MSTSQETSKRSWLHKLEISSWRCDGPPDAVWACCLREYDEGSKVFTGATQREAVNELLDYYEGDDGALRG